MPAPRPLGLAGLLLTVAAAGVVSAGPAAAIDDATHPDARVTHGPSCRPGGLVIEVVAGTLPYSVRLATTRSAEPEDEALLQPGQTAVLSTGDVAPGETIDGRLEFAAQDGSGTTFVDELPDSTFTRPTAEDCAAAIAPPSSSPAPLPVPAPVPVPLPAPGPVSTTPPPAPGPSSSPSPRSTPAPSSPVPPPTSSPTSRPPLPPPTSSRAPAPAPPPAAGSSGSGTSVPAGGTVRIRVEGYRPGERVTIELRDSGEVLASSWAADDGSVTAEVRIPDRTATGPAALDVVGGNTDAVAAVPLQVAAGVSDPGADRASSLPLLLAAGALSATGAACVSATFRRRPGR